MCFVRAALRHGVDDAARGAAVFRRIVRGRHLKFAHGVGADRIRKTRAAALFGEERLCVIAAVHGVAVQQARDAAEADQAKVAVGRRTGVINANVDQRRVLVGRFAIAV